MPTARNSNVNIAVKAVNSAERKLNDVHTPRDKLML